MVEVSKSEFTMIKSITDVLTFVLISIVLIVKSIIIASIPKSYQPLKKLEGEIVLVTGGAGGIGRLVALRLAKLNATIVLWDINAKGIEESVKLVKAEGGRVFGYTCDLTNREDIYKVAAKVTQEVGQVTIVINNAGVVSGRLLLDTPDHLIQQTFDVNILAHFWTTKAFLPKMIENNHGHIVTIASMAGHIGVHKLVDYCSSKFAAVGFDEALRLELEKLGAKGVKTTIICPYFIQSTGMFNDVMSRFFPTLKSTEVADKIIEGIQMEKLYVHIPGYLKLFCLKWVFPWSVVSIFIRNVVFNPAPATPEIISSVPADKPKPKFSADLHLERKTALKTNSESKLNHRIPVTDKKF